jgi:hypothetical protein
MKICLVATGFNIKCAEKILYSKLENLKQEYKRVLYYEPYIELVCKTEKRVIKMFMVVEVFERKINFMVKKVFEKLKDIKPLKKLKRFYNKGGFCKFGYHDWEYIYYESYGYYLKEDYVTYHKHFRVCKKCGKYQELVFNMDGSDIFWKDLDKRQIEILKNKVIKIDNKLVVRDY